MVAFDPYEQTSRLKVLATIDSLGLQSPSKTNLDLLNLALKPTDIGVTLGGCLVELHDVDHGIGVIAENSDDGVALVVQQDRTSRLEQVLVNKAHD